MSTILVLFAVAAIGIGLTLYGTWREIRSLRDRAATELSQLLSHVSDRHLILSHLVDAVPTTFDPYFNRGQLDESRQRAQRALDLVDATSPCESTLVTFANEEQSLLESMEILTGCVEDHDSVHRMQSVSACMEGLRSANKEITDTTTTYNAAAITFNTFLESSFMARILTSCQFTIVEFDPHSSGGSTTRVAS